MAENAIGAREGKTREKAGTILEITLLVEDGMKISKLGKLVDRARLVGLLKQTTELTQYL